MYLVCCVESFSNSKATSIIRTCISINFYVTQSITIRWFWHYDGFNVIDVSFNPKGYGVKSVRPILIFLILIILWILVFSFYPFFQISFKIQIWWLFHGWISDNECWLCKIWWDFKFELKVLKKIISLTGNAGILQGFPWLDMIFQ